MEEKDMEGKSMETRKTWAGPGVLRPLSDPVAQTPLRKKYDQLVNMARLIIERPDGMLVIYVRMKKLNEREMRPGETEIWQAAENKDFKKVRQLAEALLDEDPEYGWGYFYLVMAECEADGLIALSNHIIAPDGLLVCEEEPEGWHDARRSYKRALRFADENLTQAVSFMEDLNNSLLLCKKAEKALAKQSYESAIMFCAQMPIMNFNGSEEMVDKAIRAIFEQCKQAEFARMKELGRDLEQEVKTRHPAEYKTWTDKKSRTITANVKRHGAKKSTFWLALVSLVLSPLTLIAFMPVSLLTIAFAWESTRDEFYFLRGMLEFMGLAFVSFLIGEPLGIFSSFVHQSIVTAALVLGSLWFLKCGLSALKFNRLCDDLIPYNNNVIRPLNDAVREELAAEYETAPEAAAQLKEWSKWYEW